MKPLYPMLAALLAAPLAQAQLNQQPVAQSGAAPAVSKFTGPGSLGTADTSWMQQRAHGANFEFEASRLAMQKAQSKQVRAFAQMIVDDLTRSSETLRSIARVNEVLLPEHPDPAQQKELDRLQSLNGAAFDAAYLKDMRTANRHDQAAEQTEAHTVRDRALLKFVQEQRKVDLKHAQSAAQLQGTPTPSRKE